MPPKQVVSESPKEATPAPEDVWTIEEQAKFEAALRKYPASLVPAKMTAAERWDKIAEDVGRTRKQCVARFQFLRDEAVRKAEEAKKAAEAAKKAEEEKARKAAEEEARRAAEEEEKKKKKKKKFAPVVFVKPVVAQPTPEPEPSPAAAEPAGNEDDGEGDGAEGDEGEETEKKSSGGAKPKRGGKAGRGGRKKPMTKAEKLRAEAAAKAAAAKEAAKAKKAAEEKAKAGAPKKTGGDYDHDDVIANSGASAEYRSATGILESRPRALDVKIGGFSLTAYGKVLIKDTSIEFTIGRRYGLIGSNGSGKSTMLKALAAREVPIPEHIDIYHLDSEAEPSDRTAVQSVVDLAESEMKRLEALAEKALEEDGPESAIAMDIYGRLDEMDPSTFVSRAAVLLHGLGFSEEMMHKRTRDMSGGWRMRVALARALFVKPTLLLLDEPTNHLDLGACIWLEEYLATYPRCLLVVSHSQDFLNTVCTNIIHITPKKDLQNYTGNYDQFVKTKAENEVNQLKRWRKEQDDIKHIKQFIASAGTYANLVKQAKSKQKILDKMEAAGLTEKPVPAPVYKFSFTDVEKLPPPVMVFQDVAFSYSGDMKHALYQKLNLGLDLDCRIALVGPNGAGKSTLLKLMVGEIQPTEGQIRSHLHLTIGRYHQHSADQLDLNATPLEFMPRQFPEKKFEEPTWRGWLGRYGISGEQQKVPIYTLSDGIKTRLVFCMLALKAPHLLLLDEPTNHLDMESIDALAQAINQFSGGVVLVSHDFRLLQQVAKTIWVCDNKTIKPWAGDIRTYKAHLIAQMRKEEAGVAARARAM